MGHAGKNDSIHRSANAPRPKAHGACTVGLSAIALAVLATLYGCKPFGDPPPFNPYMVQENERLSTTTQPSTLMRPLPTTMQSPRVSTAKGQYPTTGPALGIESTVRMSLQECAHRAVENNLDVRAAGYEPAVDAARVIEAEAHFDPVFFTNITGQRQDNETAGSNIPDPVHPTSITSRGVVPNNVFINNDISEQYTLQTGVKQNLESGGQIQWQYQMQRNDLDPRRFVLNPYVEDQLVAQLTQPLLRNFGTEVNRARIEIARNNQKVDLLEFRKTAEQTVSDLEKAYWQLVDAIREVHIQETLVDQTAEIGDVLIRRQGGDVTRLQISQAQSDLETARAQLVRAKAHVRDLSDQIKQLMNDPDYPVSGDTLILPADDAIEEPVHFDEQELIDTSLEQRWDLGEQLLKIKNADITVEAAKNNILPQLNFVGSAGFQGIGGGWGSSFDEFSRVTHVSYGAGLQLEIPIGNREARAIWRRSVLQRQQGIDQYRALINKASAEVRVALREVQTTWNEMVVTRKAVFAASDALRAIQQRQEADEPLTPYFVQLKLDRQQVLAQAERQSALAVANYNIAISRLEQAKGTLLRYNNIMLEEDKEHREWTSW